MAEELEAENAIKKRWVRIVLAMLATYAIFILIAFLFLRKKTGR